MTSKKEKSSLTESELVFCQGEGCLRLIYRQGRQRYCESCALRMKRSKTRALKKQSDRTKQLLRNYYHPLGDSYPQHI